MLKRSLAGLLLLAAGMVALPSTAAAQQTLNFSIGYFTPKGADARGGERSTTTTCCWRIARSWRSTSPISTGHPSAPSG
jgi:hypothetical protein